MSSENMKQRLFGTLPVWFYLLAMFCSVLLLLSSYEVSLIKKRIKTTRKRAYARAHLMEKCGVEKVFKDFANREYNISLKKLQKQANMSNLFARIENSENTWQIASNPDKLCIYSAYFEKVSVSKTVTKAIRIIGTVKKNSYNGNGYKVIRCIFWYFTPDLFFKKIEVHNIHVLRDHHNTV